MSQFNIEDQTNQLQSDFDQTLNQICDEYFQKFEQFFQKEEKNIGLIHQNDFVIKKKNILIKNNSLNNFAWHFPYDEKYFKLKKMKIKFKNNQNKFLNSQLIF